MASNDLIDNSINANPYGKESIENSSATSSNLDEFDEANETQGRPYLTPKSSSYTSKHIDEEKLKYSDNPIIFEERKTLSHPLVSSPVTALPPSPGRSNDSFKKQPLSSSDPLTKPRGVSNSVLFINSHSSDKKKHLSNKSACSNSDNDDGDQENKEDAEEGEGEDSFDENQHQVRHHSTVSSRKRSSVLFNTSSNHISNQQGTQRSSVPHPTSSIVSKRMQHVRNTLKDCDASELLMFATEALDAIAVNESIENNERHLSLQELASASPEDYEIVEEEVDKLALLDLAYSHLAQRVQKRLNPATLDHLTHRLEVHESMREQDFNEMQRQKSPEKHTSTRQHRVGTLAAIWNHHLDSGLLVFYKVPIVRHRFEDAQHEHEVDWADLFFDLTYVGAAYQLGTLLKYDVSFGGFFHFCSFALCMMDAWKFKTLHDSTFEATDVVHKLTDVMYVSTIAGASIFIRPITEMEHLDTGYAFGLCLCLVCNVAVLAAEKVEILYASKDPDAIQQSRNILLIEIFPRIACFTAAAIIAGIGTEWSLNQDDDDYHVGEVKTMSLRTISLCLLASHVLSTVVPLIGYLSKFLPVNPIPWHYEHIAHRYGEWVMLMLGESILSIILTPVHNRFRYYLAFGVALLTVQMMQLVHFSSEEFDPDKHALSRKLRAGRTWVQLMTFYSIALIAFGVGLKAMLYSVVCTGEDDDHRRLGADDTSSYSSYSAYSSSYSSSYSAYGGSSAYGGDGEAIYCNSVPRAYTRLLCCASAAQYIFLQISLILHEGIREYVRHYFNFSTRAAYMLIGCKVLTIMATLELGVYSGNLRAHEIIIVIGAITLVQSLCQALENMMTHVRKLETWSVRDDKLDVKNKKSFYRQKSGEQHFLLNLIFGKQHEDNLGLRGNVEDYVFGDEENPPPPPPPLGTASNIAPSPYFRRKLFPAYSPNKKPSVAELLPSSSEPKSLTVVNSSSTGNTRRSTYKLFSLERTL